ncbi:MAG: hypothetical protein RJA22_2252 [Verrucomicrobiota bacterium]
MMTRFSLPGRRLLALAAIVGLQSVASAAPVSVPANGLIWRSHYAGRTALARGTNATVLRRVDQLPASAAFRGQIAAGLARAPREFWQKDLPAGAPDATELWNPLFADLLDAESVLEVRGPVGRTEAALAIQLAAPRAKVWNDNLSRLASLWKLGQATPLKLAGAEGWQCRRAQSPNLFQYVRIGDWVVLGLGQDPLSLAPALVQQIMRTGRPGPLADPTLLVDVHADLPALGTWFPWLTRYGLPPLHLTARGRGEHVRTEVQFRLPTPLRTTLDPWQFPTNLIGEPLTSFTVARGVNGLLNAIPGLAQAGLKPLPNQFCAWGVSNEQSRVYMAAPVANPGPAISQLAVGLPPFFKDRFGQIFGEFFYVSNRNYLFWGNIPFVQPYLQPVTNAGQTFLHAGVFPLPPRQTPPPPDLFSQLAARPTLLYYDWEITPQRILNGRLLWDLVHILSKHLPQGETSPSRLWLAAVLPELWKDPVNPSQSVTEITLASPNELRLVRKSHLGLTGFEMASLSAWADSPGFPLRYVPPRRMTEPRGTNAPPKRSVNPAAPAPR